MRLFNMNRLDRLLFTQNTVENRLFFISNTVISDSFHTSAIQRKDYYEVLNIKRNSSRQDIKLAYYKLSKQYHPDVNNTENAENYFKEIQEAYGTLADELLKKEYDQSLNGYNSNSSDLNARPSPWTGKRTSGPVYSGRTSAYDYDEHFKAHYTNVKRPYTYGGSRDANSFEGSRNQEDLNKYWNRKEFPSEKENTIRNKIFLRAIYFLFIYTIFYAVFAYSTEREKEAGMRAYQRHMDAKNNKKS